jgi:hypothetical protein
VDQGLTGSEFPPIATIGNSPYCLVYVATPARFSHTSVSLDSSVDS